MADDPIVEPSAGDPPPSDPPAAEPTPAADPPADPPAGDPAPAHWLDKFAGISDDDRKFVGDRDLAAVLGRARGLREAAAKASPGVQLPQEGEDFGDRLKVFRPETVDDYASIIGKKADDLTPRDKIEMEAALNADMHKDQFRRLYEGRRDQEDEAAKALGEEVATSLKEEWGVEFDEKTQKVERAAKMLGDDWAQALSQPGLEMGAEGQKQLLNAMAKLGEFFTEGGPIDVGNNRGAQSLEEERADIEAASLERELKPSEQARLKTLNQKIAEEKVNG